MSNPNSISLYSQEPCNNLSWVLSERASEGFGCVAERNILVTVLEYDNKCDVDISHSFNSL